MTLPSSDLLLAALGLASAAATLVGGLAALRYTDRLHLVLGFSAGAVIGVALLDLLPEAFARAGGPSLTTLARFVIGGFLLYMIVDRLAAARGGHAGHRGHLGAASLTLHSLMDGLGVGLGFQVSTKVGLILALAVIAHDIADGLNTVSLSLGDSHAPNVARRWLIADAAAPIVGIAASRLIHLPPAAFAPLLAAFAGFFLYIGASELIPESHHRHPHAWTTATTVLGALFIGIVVQLAGGL